MKINLTLRREGADVDLTVTADSTATIGDVAAALGSGDPETPGPLLDPLAVTIELLDPARGSSLRVIPPDANVMEAGLRSGSMVSVVDATRAASHYTGEAAMVTIIEGPDRGRTFSLPFGSSMIGRTSECGVRLADETVSKLHARITVGTVVEVQDNNSANGVVIGETRVTRGQIGRDDVVTIGETKLKVTQLRTSGQQELSNDFGFVRAPRVVARVPKIEIRYPTPPAEDNPQAFPLISLIAPLFMGITMMIMYQNARMAIFMIMMPLFIVGSFLDQKFRSKRKKKKDIEKFVETLARTEVDIAEGFAEERVARLEQFPSVREVVDDVVQLGPMLWSRRPEHPEFLELRLGIGADKPQIKIEKPRIESGMPEYVDQLKAVAAKYTQVDGVPIVASLRQEGSLGIAGPEQYSMSFARSIVAQVVGLHSPAEVVLGCLTNQSRVEEWRWLQWLPHTSSPQSPLGHRHLASDAGSGAQILAMLEGIVAHRGKKPDDKPKLRGQLEEDKKDEDKPTTPAIVVIVDSASVDFARLNHLVEIGPDVGIHFIWISERLSEIPGACRTFVDLSETGTNVGRVRQSVTTTPLQWEGINDPGIVARLGRLLAPVFDAGVAESDDSDLPRSISYVDLTGAELADDVQTAAERWIANGSVHQGLPMPRKHPVALHALVGQGQMGPFYIDLKSQGPHALVGGTTGSGKSEFLQAWVLGMAQSLSPEQVTFLFVDYKGGSAFAKCVELPHCVGLVTDLSPYLVQRALTSLRAELHYRERLLNRKGAKDLATLEMAGDPEAPPSLVIVVDEFAALAKEIPEFVDGMVDVAQRGRSLGLHLILATQRPAGVIKDNLRANTNLRIALRMADEADSKDVLGDNMAAWFDPAIPGRAAAKTGPGRIAQFQSAYPGAHTEPEHQVTSIAVGELPFDGGRPWNVPTPPKPPATVDTDISRVVSTLRKTAEAFKMEEPRKPWLPELATSYDLNKLNQRRDSELVLGVVDDPDMQSQYTDYFRPDTEGHIAYFGGPGSGKSTALRSLAIAAGITPRSGPVHVYGLDFLGGGLRMLENLPHVGAIIPGDDDERVARLLTMLTDIASERMLRYGTVRASSLTEYRSIAGKPDEPRILLVIDGFSTFRQSYSEDLAKMSKFHDVEQLLTDGRAVGIHIAASMERSTSAAHSVTSLFTRRIVLRQPTTDGYLALGVPKDILTPDSPPGRGILPDSKHEIQLAILGDSVNAVAQSRTIEALAEFMRTQKREDPKRVESLPTEVPEAAMPRDVGGLPVLGLADVDLRPFGFAPQGAYIVAGPAQSGRTNTVHWLAKSLKKWSPDLVTVHISPRRTPLSGSEIWDMSFTGEEAITGVIPTLLQIVEKPAAEGRPTIALFMENFPEHIQTVVEPGLLDVVKKARRNGHLVIAEGETSSWQMSWPLVMEVRNARAGILLQPNREDGDLLLRTSLGRFKAGAMPQGRGFWVNRGKAMLTQIPLVGE